MSNQFKFWLFNDAQQLLVSDVTSVSLPAGATLRAGMAFTTAGELCIDTGAPSGSLYVNGIRMRTDGAVYAKATTPVQYANGLPVDANGALCLEAASTTTFQGLGYTAAGAISTISLVPPPDPTLISQLRFLGASGSTTFTDDVQPPRIWTPSGTTQIVTDVTAAAGTSGFFTTVGNGSLETPYVSDLNVSGPSAIFCREIFVKQTILPGPNHAALFGQWTNDGGGEFDYRQFVLVFTSSGGNLVLLSAIATDDHRILVSPISSNSVALSTWVHVAFYKPVSVAGIYMSLNGVVTAAFAGRSISPVGTFGAAPVTEQIGNYWNAVAGGAVTGNMQGYRAWTGSCPYGASNFTPPTPPFPAL